MDELYEIERIELLNRLVNPYRCRLAQYEKDLSSAFVRAASSGDMDVLATGAKQLTEGLNKDLVYLTNLIE
ncbi:MAG: hypothetical protein Q8O89_07250 [Nanoarchaeota archaeon]|nr:hypothetical protein [Nanoarchaeota archaeon]